MIINKSEYLINPCKSTSIPYWKAKSITIPNGISIVHHDDFGVSEWQNYIDEPYYAETCSWRAGKALADAMNHNAFTDWERVIVALDNGKICGYCTVAKTDCIPDTCYTPYIGYLFVDEEYRGNRLSRSLGLGRKNICKKFLK